jgi:hypothetical protein
LSTRRFPSLQNLRRRTKVRRRFSLAAAGRVRFILALRLARENKSLTGNDKFFSFDSAARHAPINEFAGRFSDTRTF